MYSYSLMRVANIFLSANAFLALTYVNRHKTIRVRRDKIEKSRKNIMIDHKDFDNRFEQVNYDLRKIKKHRTSIMLQHRST